MYHDIPLQNDAIFREIKGTGSILTSKNVENGEHKLPFLSR